MPITGTIYEYIYKIINLRSGLGKMKHIIGEAGKTMRIPCRWDYSAEEIGDMQYLF